MLSNTRTNCCAAIFPTALNISCATSWARLIKKVYEVDPLECPRCKGPMRVIALINDAGVVQRILKHLGLWAPRQNERASPALDASIEAALPADNVLTCHPVRDIA